MEQKTSVVKSTSFKNSFIGKYGEQFSHTIEFDNGDKGEYVSKSKDQNKFVVGQSVEYQIEEVNGFMKVKPVQAQQFGKKPYDQSAETWRQYLILAQSSLTKAIDLVNHGNLTFDKLESATDKLMAIQVKLANKYKDEHE